MRTFQENEKVVLRPSPKTGGIFKFTEVKISATISKLSTDNCFGRYAKWLKLAK